MSAVGTISTVDPHQPHNATTSKLRFGPDFNPDYLVFILELGRGNGGVVSKTRHVPTGQQIVRKSFELDVKPAVRTQILRDLQTLNECSCPSIVDYFGVFPSEQLSKLHVCLEYMDAGGLDSLLSLVGRLPEPIIVEIAASVLQALTYLWREHGLMHQNLKPSNILLNRAGTVKVCDFVVSMPLVEAFASAFVGMRTYLSPESLVGERFSSASDVWSLGLTLMELAIGHYPIPAADPVDFVRAFAPDRESNMSEQWKAARDGEPLSALDGPTTNTDPLPIFHLFAHIVEQPAPRLPAYCFSAGFIDFIHSCLHKEPTDRLGLSLLTNQVRRLQLEEQPTNSSRCRLIDELPAGPADQFHSTNVSVAGYLRGIFARQQNEALDAVALAVSEDFDAIDDDSDDDGVIDTAATAPDEIYTNRTETKRPVMCSNSGASSPFNRAPTMLINSG